MSIRKPVFAALIFFAASAPAFAADVAFTAALRGDTDPTNTGSTATGDARITVHTDAKTVDVALKVTGLKMDAFFAHLAHAPVGPMHLHLYAPNGNVSLVLPFPLGPGYAATTDGFTYATKNYPYADGAKILNSDVSFDDFLAAMKSGAVLMNVHTEKFHDGEISGYVKTAP